MHVSKQNRLLLAVMLLLVGMVVRAWDLGEVSFWGDEITTRQRAVGSLHDTIDHISRGGVHFLPYFASLHLFPTDNELLLRMPSVFMALLGVALMIRAVRFLSGEWGLALIAGALLALNPYHIHLTRMARPYAQLFFFSLLASYLFVRLLSGRRSTVTWIAYLLASAAVLQSHYFALALPAAQLATLVIVHLAGQNQRRLIVRWAGVQVVAFVPLILWLALVIRPKQGAMDWIPNPTWEAPLRTVGYLAVGYESAFAGYFVPAIIVAAVGLIASLFFAVKILKRDPSLLYWAILTIGPVLGVFMISVVSRHSYYMDRYFMALLPGVLILMLLGWQYLSGRWWVPVGAAVLLATSAGFVIREFRTGENYERFAWRQSIDYVRAHMQPGDYMALPYYDPAFEYYYGYMHEGPLIPLYVMHDQLQGYFTFAELPYDRAWVFYAPELHDDRVRAWIDKQDILQTVEFNGLQVILLQPREE